MKAAVVCLLLALAATQASTARKKVEEKEKEEATNKAKEVNQLKAEIGSHKKLQEANKEMMTVDEDASVEVQGGPPIWREWIDEKLALKNGYALAKSASLSGVWGHHLPDALKWMPDGAELMKTVPDISFKIKLTCEDPPKGGALSTSAYGFDTSSDLRKSTKTEFLGNMTEQMHGLQGPNIDIYYEDKGSDAFTAFRLGENVLPCERLNINMDLGVQRDAGEFYSNQKTAEQMLTKLKENTASKGGDRISGIYNLARGIVNVPEFDEYEKHTMAFELTQTCENFKGIQDEGNPYPYCHQGKKAMLALKLKKSGSYIYGYQVAIYLRKE